jgi:hypothetical protein
MRTAKKSARIKTAIRVRTRSHERFDNGDDDSATDLTDIRITRDVEVGTLDGYLRFWVAGREIRIGPLTPEQAEQLADDLGYDAVA